MLNTPELRQWIEDQLTVRGWSRTYLANQVEVNPSAFHHFFNAKTNSLNPATAAKLADLFGVTYSHLEAISKGKGDEYVQRVAESGEVYETKWIRMGKWIEEQPREIQAVFEAFAKSHHWDGGS